MLIIVGMIILGDLLSDSDGSESESGDLNVEGDQSSNEDHIEIKEKAGDRGVVLAEDKENPEDEFKHKIESVCHVVKKVTVGRGRGRSRRCNYKKEIVTPVGVAGPSPAVEEGGPLPPQKVAKGRGRSWGRYTPEKETVVGGGPFPPKPTVDVGGPSPPTSASHSRARSRSPLPPPEQQRVFQKDSALFSRLKYTMDYGLRSVTRNEGMVRMLDGISKTIDELQRGLNTRAQEVLRRGGNRILVAKARRRIFDIGAGAKEEIQEEVERLADPRLNYVNDIDRERVKRVTGRYLGAVERLEGLNTGDLM